jgi:hypothetical protein
MVARLASIAQRYQKVAGSSPAVVIEFPDETFILLFIFILEAISIPTFFKDYTHK